MGVVLIAGSAGSALRAVRLHMADIVAKVENRTTPKISRKSIFRRFYPCKALQRQYEGP
jgi:hypothetical protein